MLAPAPRAHGAAAGRGRSRRKKGRARPPSSFAPPSLLHPTPHASNPPSRLLQVVGWGVDRDGTPYWSIRNSWGAFWGELGFFKLERGTDALFLESGDCWAAEVGWAMEKGVRAGRLQGTMFGVVPAPGCGAGEDGGEGRGEGGLAAQ